MSFDTIQSSMVGDDSSVGGGTTAVSIGGMSGCCWFSATKQDADLRRPREERVRALQREVEDARVRVIFGGERSIMRGNIKCGCSKENKQHLSNIIMSALPQPAAPADKALPICRRSARVCSGNCAVSGAQSATDSSANTCLLGTAFLTEPHDHSISQS